MCHYMSSLLLALGLFAVVVIASANPEGGLAFSQATYDELNSYLEINHFSDPMVGIFKLEKLLHEEQERGKNPLVFNGRRIKALEQIIRLRYIADPNRPFCDEVALKIILQNEYSIRADRSSILLLQINLLLEDLKPIQSLVLHFITEHAKACSDVYPELMKTKVSSLNQTNLDLVKKLLSGVVELKLKKEKERNPEYTDSEAIYGALIARPNIIARQDTQIINVALKEVSKNDPKHKYLDINKEGLSKDQKMERERGGVILLEKYLLKPCRYYIEELKSIVEPTWHDFKFGMRLSDDKMEFYHALALFGLCTNLVYPQSSS